MSYVAVDRSIEAAVRGGNLHRSTTCPPPPVTATPDSNMSVKTLKVG